jgi:hypothetical protein
VEPHDENGPRIGQIKFLTTEVGRRMPKFVVKMRRLAAIRDSFGCRQCHVKFPNRATKSDDLAEKTYPCVHACDTPGDHVAPVSYNRRVGWLAQDILSFFPNVLDSGGFCIFEHWISRDLALDGRSKRSPGNFALPEA